MHSPVYSAIGFPAALTSLSNSDLPERQIDARITYTHAAWQVMAVMRLCGPTQIQQAAGFEIQIRALGRIAAVAQAEFPGRAETQRRDDRIGAQFGFVVAVPTHAIASVTVEIAQHCIEAMRANGADGIAQFDEYVGPRLRLVARTRIRVHRSGIAYPARQTRRIVDASEQFHTMLLPGDSRLQARVPIARDTRIAKTCQTHVGIGKVYALPTWHTRSTLRQLQSAGWIG